MQLNKNLVILTSRFPLYSGEYFIEDEILYASKYFENIFIVCIHKPIKLETKERKLPQNVIVIELVYFFKPKDYLNLFSIFKNNFVFKEIYYAIKKHKISNIFKLLRIILKEYLIGITISDKIIANKQLNNLLKSNAIFYSYWSNFNALSIVLIKNKYNINAISRAHGWDIDANRHKPPYLPFKKYIIDRLNHTFCISDDGLFKLNNLTNNKFRNKISVSRLGKPNHRKVNSSANSNSITIVSCSNIIPLKRIHLIIDILAQLDLDNITWYHYGDGYLKDEIINYANLKIPNIDCRFMGIVNNNLILDFYSENYIDLFINVSETEGIPVSIMEAQSAGIPVLATNVGGTSEIVNNKNGFLIDKSFEVVSVANMIKKYLKSNDEIICEKRNYAYQNWKLNYNAHINYTEFYKNINV